LGSEKAHFDGATDAFSGFIASGLRLVSLLSQAVTRKPESTAEETSTKFNAQIDLIEDSHQRINEQSDDIEGGVMFYRVKRGFKRQSGD
jgi:hypothetical protein